MAYISKINFNGTIYDIKDKNALTEHQDLSSYAKKTDVDAVVDKVKTLSRNIGEIVASTLPLVDAGLHLLDGALIVGGGIYDQFVQYIAKLYNEGGYTLYAYVYTETTTDTETSETTTTDYIIYTKDKTLTANSSLYNADGTVYSGTDFTNANGTIKYGENACTYTEGSNIWVNTASYFTTEEQWQDSVTKYGVCGKFVYSASDNTVRLPKITGFIEGTIDIETLGDIIPQDVLLPNVYSGSDDNIKIQPQTTKVLYYIVIATSTKTDVQVEMDKYATDLNNKVDKDGTNAEFAHITESYVNGSSWYRIYSDGWCEQGGLCSTSTVVTYLKPFRDTNYTVTGGLIAGTSSGTYEHMNIQNRTTTKFYFQSYDHYSLMWKAEGYIR